MQAQFLKGLEDEDVRALPFIWEFWAHEHQLAPEGAWRNWIILGGRGSGKTRAGAEWVRSQVEGSRPYDVGRARRVALVAETYDQARDVMVFGESGIMACSPPDRRPEWQATRRRLIWPNGAEAKCFSAHDAEGLRGPQFDAAWADELAKWPANEAWSNLQFALRLGEDPRAVVTTTPRNVHLLRDLLNDAASVQTQAPTDANRAYLASSFLEHVRTQYANTRKGRQELDGILLEDVEGALWTTDMLEQAAFDIRPEVDRIVVAVDPP
ncbi:MAG: terminase family protein, partial [Pseudomonadota bacterium]